MADRALSVVQNAAVVESDSSFGLSHEQIDLLRRTVARDLETDEEFLMFIAFCRSMGLDPFTRQVYVLKRYDSRLGKSVVTYGIGIDGLRSLAERTGEYQGQVGPFWCGPDGEWKDVWLDEARPPAAAKVGVLRRGWPEPLWAVARWKTYAQYKRGTQELMSNWESMPDLMLAKCAEALALRKAFPRQTGGLYIPEEMGVTFDDARSGESERMPESPRITVQSSAPAKHPMPQGDEDWIAAIEGASDVPTLARIGNELIKRYRDRRHPVRQVFERRMSELQSGSGRQQRGPEAVEMTEDAQRRQQEALSLVTPYGWDLDHLQRWMREQGIHRWSDLTDKHLSALLDELADAAEWVEPEDASE